MHELEKETDQTPTLHRVRTILPEVHAPARLYPPMALSHYEDRLLKAEDAQGRL